MKRFLGVLIASMFLASAAYAAEDMKKADEKKAAADEKKADAKDAKAKNGKTKDAKAKDAKGGEKVADVKADEKKTKQNFKSIARRKVALPTFLCHLNPSSNRFPLTTSLYFTHYRGNLRLSCPN